jgi:hypothetical protein
MSDNPVVKELSNEATLVTFSDLDKPEELLKLQALLQATVSPPVFVVPVPVEPATPTVPTKKSRPHDWNPNQRQKAILSIPRELSLQEYSMELDKKVSWRVDWAGPWKNGPIPEHPHYEAWLAGNRYLDRLKSERRNTWVAFDKHPPKG